MQSSSVTRDEKKTRKKKRKNKDGMAKDMEASIEGVSKEETARENNQTKNVKKTSKISAGEGTSSVRNLGDANASTAAKAKKKAKNDGMAKDMEASIEGVSKKEIARENNQTKNVKKTSKISAGEGTSSVRNLGDANALTAAKAKKKAKKDGMAKDMEASIEGVSKKEIARENNQTKNVKKTSKISAGEGTSSVRNLGDANAFTAAKAKKKAKKDGMTKDMEASIEGVSKKEIARENNQTKNVKKTSKISAGEGTSSVRNLGDANASTAAEAKKKAKKVNFSGHVEVFPSTNDAKSSDQTNDEGLVRGKRFSQEEDELIKQAVFDYIEGNKLGERGLDMVLNCRSHAQVRHCWKEIGAAISWRPQTSVYLRAHNLFRRSKTRKWEPEELDLVLRYYKEHGPKWKEMADLLGKHRIHIKDTWRRIKLTNAKKGAWSQEEYQTLFNLVNVDLQLRAFEEKNTKYGMIRDNISWGAISGKLSTRYDAACCLKWYGQLTSSMVAQGLWADTDDYRLIDKLLKLDASCIEDVEWDNLLENRSGDLCLKRWKQMTRYIGGHREKSFVEQVELLATRYCPNMLQYRTWNQEKCGENVDGT